MERQQRAWEQHVELQAARSAALISNLEAQVATLEARIQSRLGELRDGEPGPAGEKGEKGERGSSGLHGPRGEAGAAGERGLPGPVGDKGERGERGSAGLHGPRGLRGEKGDRGERGEAGKRGPDGNKGEKGETGERGDKGDPGETGEAGERGPQGEAGIQGPRGEAGQPGPQGEPGPVGDKGERGEPGLQGGRGDKGDKGDPGLLPMVREWAEDEVCYRGDVVAFDGGTWQAKKDTAQKPPHRDWIPLALAGRGAVNPIIRGTFDPAQNYDALNIVALNGSSFIARCNDPGECPGDGWQLIASCGRAGKPGPKGERGDKGERGLPGPSVLRGEIDGKTYTMTLVNADGSTVSIPCRAMFERYHEDSNG